MCPYDLRLVADFFRKRDSLLYDEFGGIGAAYAVKTVGGFSQGCYFFNFTGECPRA